ncbi:MAG TPA: biosynthetic peptidoglycan transglycosylase [Polyangiaceae bacterium]
MRWEHVSESLHAQLSELRGRLAAVYGRLAASSTKTKLLLLLPLLFLVAVPFVFDAWVVAQAESRAKRAGVELSIDDVGVGWGRVELSGVTVRILDVPSLRAELHRIEIEPSVTLGVKTVTVRGARVSIAGSPSDVRAQLRRWRGRSSGTSARASGMAYSVNGVDFAWRHAGQELRAWGARYERDAGAEQIRADLLRLWSRGARADLRGLRVRLVRTPGGRALEGAGIEQASADIDLDALMKAFSSADADRQPPTVTAGHATGSGAQRAAFLPVRAASEVRKFRSVFTSFARDIERATLLDTRIDAPSLRLKLRRGGETLNIGPAVLRAARGADHVRVSLIPTSQVDRPLTLALLVPLAQGEVKLELEGGPVSLASLGIQEGDFGLHQVQRAELHGKGALALSADGQMLRFAGDGRVRQLSLQHRALAAQALSGIELGVRGKGELALDGSRIRLEPSELQFGELRITGGGELERGENHTRAVLQADVPLIACQDLLESIPHGFAPMLAGMRVSGTFTFDGQVDVDTRQLDAMQLDWQIANDCRITAASEEIAPARFSEPWEREVMAGDGRLMRIDSGPGTPNWVPYRGISPHMETAVLISEDGRFFRHSGFDPEAIRNSIRENIRSKRFVRGASTISMQLAKNLYLRREKTLARKFQEAILTQLLEQELSKEQMMELYLNVIEFAPGIYGVGPAAQYYFNTSPAQLSLGQALYMASILPNPRQRHFGADGQVTPGWMGYLRKLMYIGFKIKRVTEEELADGLLEQVTFGVPYSPRVVHEDTSMPVDEAQFDPVTPQLTPAD